MYGILNGVYPREDFEGTRASVVLVELTERIMLFGIKVLIISVSLFEKE